MDEILTLIQAKLDEAKSKSNINADIEKIQQQLDKLKLQAEIDPKSISNLTKQLESILNQKITISNIGINQQQANKTGQQIGQLISDSAEKAISKVSSNSIGKYFKVDSSTSNKFRSEMEKLVSEWTNAKGILTDINIQTRTSYDQNEGKNIERLHQATVTYKNELDEVIKKTIAWRQIGTTTNAKGEEEILRGFVEVAGQYSKSIDTVSTKTDTFVEKQKKAVTDISNQLNKIYQGAMDLGASKPIKDNTNRDNLTNKYNEITTAIQKMSNASKATFTDEQNNVKTLISDLEIMVKQYKNAETVATSLRSKDIDTVKSQYSSKLDVLLTKMESSGVLSNGFQKGADNLRHMLDNTVDASGLTQFLNGLDKLEAGYKRADAAAKAFNQSQKVGINVSGLESKIADLQRISPEIDKFETEINGAKVTIESLLVDLSKVSTQGDFSVVNSKWKAFTNAAKSAGIAVTEIGTNAESIASKVNKIQLSLDTGTYESKVESLISKTRQWVDENGNARISTDNLSQALNNLNSASNTLANNNTIANQQALISAEKDLKTQLDTVTNAVRKMNAELAKSSSISSLHNQVADFMSKNGKTVRYFGDELRYVFNQTSQGAKLTNQELIALKQRFIEIQNEARQTGKLGKTGFQTLKEGMSSFSYWTSSTFIVMKTINEIRKAINTVTALDTALVDLRKTANMTSQELEDFYYTSNDVAKQMGVTTQEIIEQAAAWSRLGFNTAEAATKMAQLSSKFASISPGMSTDQAQSGLVSIIKAWGLDVSEVEREIMDNINTLGRLLPKHTVMYGIVYAI